MGFRTMKNCFVRRSRFEQNLSEKILSGCIWRRIQLVAATHSANLSAGV
jgi:hypothetical protein